MSKKLVIGGACLNQIPMDWAHNLRNIKAAVVEAKNKGVQLLCLPELCLTGYGCEDLFLSHWLPKKALSKLTELIPLSEGIAFTVGLPVRIEDQVYNTCCLLHDGKIVGFYAKHHLANDGVHYEKRWFSSWPYQQLIDFEIDDQTVPFGAFQTTLHGVKIAFEICEDAWLEDRPACHFLEPEVDLILNPSASHFAFRKGAFRENLVAKSSKRFNCAYLYTNLLGNEAGRMIYDGDILVAQQGKLIGRNKRLSFADHNLLSLTLDLDGASETQVQDDWENRLEELSRVIPLALFDYLRKSRSQGFVLSLSGGADSSSIATMVAHMVHEGLADLGHAAFERKLGFKIPEDPKAIINQLLVTAYQGTKNSSEDTLNSAKGLADSLGAKFHHWLIDEEVAQYRQTIENAVGRDLKWETDDIALQNIQARARSPIIWMLANLDRFLLLSTSNRSEGDVGYATMDGDTSGSISPIAAIDKDLVLEWLRYAEKELGYEGLKFVNALQPTAELRPPDQKQTDEDDLMPYSVLVKIEEWAIRERHSPVEVFRAMQQDYSKAALKQWITKFFRLWSINQWKRERIAPSFHVDDFNIDPKTWCRFPILSSGFKEELEELNQL
ncbi:MAG: NAD(+) synthase [Cytophagales bacterium]|nr:NAD(+) synthase [Cytophagales bacterium]